MIPGGSKAFQVDPGAKADSTFAAALEVSDASFVALTWIEFMTALGERVAQEQTLRLEGAVEAMVTRERLDREDVNPQVERMRQMGLVGLGKLRSSWLLHDKEYLADDLSTREFLADLMIALGQIARETNSHVSLAADGTVQFFRNGRLIAICVIASGRGTMGQAALETRLQSRVRRYRMNAHLPSIAIVGAVRSAGIPELSPPDSLLLGDVSDDILLGSSGLRIILVESIRQDPNVSRDVVP